MKPLFFRLLAVTLMLASLTGLSACDQNSAPPGSTLNEQQLWDFVKEDKGAFEVTTPTGTVNVRG